MTNSRSHPFSSPSSRARRIPANESLSSYSIRSYGPDQTTRRYSQAGSRSVDTFNEFRANGFSRSLWESDASHSSQDNLRSLIALGSSRNGQRRRDSGGGQSHVVGGGGRRGMGVRFPKSRDINGGIGESPSSTLHSHSNSRSSLLYRSRNALGSSATRAPSTRLPLFSFESSHETTKGQFTSRDKGERGGRAQVSWKGRNGGGGGAFRFSFPSRSGAGVRKGSRGGTGAGKSFVASLVDTPLFYETASPLDTQDPALSSTTSTFVDRQQIRGPLPFLNRSASLLGPSSFDSQRATAFSHNRTGSSPVKSRPVSMSPKVGWKRTLKTNLSPSRTRSPLATRTNQSPRSRGAQFGGRQSVVLCVPKPRLGFFAPLGDLNDFIIYEEPDLFSPTAMSDKGKGREKSLPLLPRIDGDGQMEGGSFTRVKRENEVSRMERDRWYLDGLRSPRAKSRSRQRELSTDFGASPTRASRSTRGMDRTPTRRMMGREPSEDVENLAQSTAPSVNNSPQVPRSFDPLRQVTQHLRQLSWNDDRSIDHSRSGHQRSASHSGAFSGQAPPRPPPFHLRSSSADHISSRSNAFERRQGVGTAISNSDVSKDHASPGILSKERNAFVSLPPRMHHLLFEDKGDSLVNEPSGVRWEDESLIISMPPPRRTSHGTTGKIDDSPMDRFTAVFPSTQAPTQDVDTRFHPDPTSELMTLHQALSVPPSTASDSPIRTESFPTCAASPPASRRTSALATFGRDRVLSLSEWQQEEESRDGSKLENEGSDGSEGEKSFLNLDEEDEGFEDLFFEPPSAIVAKALQTTFERDSFVSDSFESGSIEATTPPLPLDSISIRSVAHSSILISHSSHRHSSHVELATSPPSSLPPLPSPDEPTLVQSHFSDTTSLPSLHSRRQTFRSTWTTTSFGNAGFMDNFPFDPSPSLSSSPSTRSFLDLNRRPGSPSPPIERQDASASSFIDFEPASDERRYSGVESERSFLSWEPDSPEIVPTRGEEEEEREEREERGGDGRVEGVEMDLFGSPRLANIRERAGRSGLGVEARWEETSRASAMSASSGLDSLVAGFPSPPLDDDESILHSPFDTHTTTSRPSLRRFPAQFTHPPPIVPSTLNYTFPSTPTFDANRQISLTSLYSQNSPPAKGQESSWDSEDDDWVAGGMTVERRMSEVTSASIRSALRE